MHQMLKAQWLCNPIGLDTEHIVQLVDYITGYIQVGWQQATESPVACMCKPPNSAYSLGVHSNDASLPLFMAICICAEVYRVFGCLATTA